MKRFREQGECVSKYKRVYLTKEPRNGGLNALWMEDQLTLDVLMMKEKRLWLIMRALRGWDMKRNEIFRDSYDKNEA